MGGKFSTSICFDLWGFEKLARYVALEMKQNDPHDNI